MLTLLAKTKSDDIGLIGHIIVNYPTPALAQQAVAVMVDAGVQLIELQIPFSEPVADGPVMMRANHRALANGVTVAHCFDFMQQVASKYPIPFVFMGYANVVFHQGFENFVVKAKEAGARGAIVPDLPFDMAPDYIASCAKHDFAHIQLVPPNIKQERLVQLLNATNGFVYAVARGGVTGEQSTFNQELINHLQRIRAQTDLPIAVGFGIQSKAEVDWLKPYADYAIIGSKALEISEKQGITGLREFWQGLT